MVELTKELVERPEFIEKIRNIIANGDVSVLTASQIRHELEEHFQLEQNALSEKPYKKLISGFIDKVYNEIQQKEDANDFEPATAPASSHPDRKASPQKQPVSNKRKASPVPKSNSKKAKLEDEENESSDEDLQPRKKRNPRKKTNSSNIIEDSGDEEGNEVKERSASPNKDEDMKSDDDDDEEEEEEEDSFTPPPPKKSAPKKSSSEKATVKKNDTKHPASAKQEETIKRLKQFINKCGVRKVWSRELADCKTPTAEINKLKQMLEELGVHGRPSNDKCEAVKKERELKAELEGLDTSLILEDSGRKSRLRGRTQSKPSYALDNDSDDEEEQEENQDDDKEDSAVESEQGEEDNGDDDDEESSDDEFEGDDSDPDA